MKYGLMWSAEDVVQNGNLVIQGNTFKTGVINWPRLFGGLNYRAFRIDPNEFDVVHVQLTGDTLDVVRDLRNRIKGDTKLVVNPDYAINYWHHYGPIPETVIDTFRMADYVFGQCERSADILSCLLGRDVPCIPHPLDTRWLKRRSKKAEKRSKEDIVIMAHRDESQHTPYFMTRNMRGQVATHLLGWRGQEGFMRDVVHTYYDHVHPQMSNVDVIEKFYANALCVIDHYTHSVQGRATMEAAALGTPCLGFDCVDAQKHCFPDLTSAIGDIKDQIDKLDWLLNHADMDTISAHAKAKAEDYNFANSRTKFMNMIEGKDASNVKFSEAAD